MAEERPDCAYLSNPGTVPEATGWDSPECCLRVGVFRFPPYVDLAGRSVFPDFDADPLHVCGSVIENLKILSVAVNCSCLVRLPSSVSASMDTGLMDLRVVADYSHSTSDMYPIQADHYPLGSMSVGSILGRETPTAPPGIKYLDFYTPGVWIGFSTSVLAVSLIMALTSYLIRITSNQEGYFWKLLPAKIMDTLAVKWDQSMSWYIRLTPTTPGCTLTATGRLWNMRAIIIGIWSLLSAFILARVATANLLETLLYAEGTNRFTSLANLVERISQDRKLKDLIVVTFNRSPLYYSIMQGDVHLPHWEMLDGNDNSRIVDLLSRLEQSGVVLVGVAATLHYIKSIAINLLDCAGDEGCGDWMYIQEDAAHSVPYYVKTARTHWPADKLKVWRRTTATLLESGLAEFAYRRALLLSVPQVARELSRDALRHSQVGLCSNTLDFDEFYAIANLCFGACGLACEWFLFELCVSTFFANGFLDEAFN